MEIEKFFLKEKGNKKSENKEDHNDILWEVTIYDNHEVEVEAHTKTFSFIKRKLFQIFMAVFKPIKVTQETAQSELLGISETVIKAHRKHLEENGLAPTSRLYYKPKEAKPNYIG